MDLRTTIRRARAVAGLYLDATVKASIAYRGNDVGSVEHKVTLNTLALYQDGLDQIISEIGAWATYKTLREGTTIGTRLAGSGAGLSDGRAEWRARVGADLDARIADPKGTRKTPLPRP